ncbi:MAG: Adenylate cyclase [Myxococcaceae bacterium]|nr:Adenylate cyclase [Myxococcaceae bacterium]
MWQLIINGPGYFDTAYELPEGVTHMGRADENDIVLSGDLVSRKHARITVKGDALQAEDLGSRNGSKVNGVALIGTSPLVAGDILQVGENALVIKQPSTVENAATEMVDLGAGGAVKRFGRGIDIGSAVILARDVRDSVVLKVLDNISPFSAASTPFATDSDILEDDQPKTSEVDLDAGKKTSPIAWQSLVMLFKVAEKLATTTSLQPFLEDVTDRVMERVGATTGVVLLRHSSGVMVPAAVRHGGKLEKGEVPVSDAVVDAALAKGAAIVVNDVRDDERFAERESVVLYGVDQVLCIPIGTGAPWAGVLYLNRDGRSDESVADLLDVATAVGQLIYTGVQKFEERLPSTDLHLRKALERFHAPDIVERRVAELKKKGAKLTSLEEQPVTVLFADIAGFSALAHKVTPDRVVELLNEFYQRATTTIFSFEGTVDKFLGDGVMALFGAPYSKGDDALRAVRCAVALKMEWEKAMSRRPPRERCELKMGLNTGKVLAGTVGSEARLDYTAIGEPVNIASWVCATGEPGQVLITGKTLAAIGARFDVTPLGERPLFGSKVRTAVFEVIEEDSGTGTLSGVKGP